MDFLVQQQSQYRAFAAISTGAVLLTVVAYLVNPLLFQRFLGKFNPILAALLAALVGAIFLAVLLHRGWFVVLIADDARRFLLPAGIAALMAAVMIAVDLASPFPKDMNVALPGSLLFYPVVGYVVEILFHVLPLTVLLLLATALFRKADINTIIWPCILIVALLEPALQIGFGWPVFVALHIFAFNVIEMAFFKRYDFTTMYSFRLAYYLLWHILWGHIRIGLLF